MAKNDPRYRALHGLILLESYYPLPWILGDFTNLDYYKPDTAPTPFNEDFIVVERSKNAEIETKLAGAYYKRDFHLRDAQEECTVYFSAKAFHSWFAGPPDIQAGSQQ